MTIELVWDKSDCSLDIGALRIQAAPKAHPPFSCQAIVEEQDTYLILSEQTELKDPGKPVWYLASMIENAETYPLGSVIIKGKSPLRLCAVVHDIEQEPDFPGQYDIQVKHKRTALTFHHFDAEFKNGEFINIRKALNGVKLETETDNWSGIITTGKQRSEPKKFETIGNGTNQISIGHGSLLEDSVKVWVNNGQQQEGLDYEVNYFEGKITFATPKLKTDYIEVIYEFTNPIEDFIPVLSRKNFLGAQYLWRTNPKAEQQILQNNASDSFRFVSPNLQIKTSSENIVPSANLNRVFSLQHAHVVLGSEIVKLNNRYLKKNIDK